MSSHPKENSQADSVKREWSELVDHIYSVTHDEFFKANATRVQRPRGLVEDKKRLADELTDKAVDKIKRRYTNQNPEGVIDDHLQQVMRGVISPLLLNNNVDLEHMPFDDLLYFHDLEIHEHLRAVHEMTSLGSHEAVHVVLRIAEVATEILDVLVNQESFEFPPSKVTESDSETLDPLKVLSNLSELSALGNQDIKKHLLEKHVSLPRAKHSFVYDETPQTETNEMLLDLVDRLIQQRVDYEISQSLKELGRMRYRWPLRVNPGNKEWSEIQAKALDKVELGEELPIKYKRKLGPGKPSEWQRPGTTANLAYRLIQKLDEVRISKLRLHPEQRCSLRDKLKALHSPQNRIDRYDRWKGMAAFLPPLDTSCLNAWMDAAVALIEYYCDGALENFDWPQEIIDRVKSKDLQAGRSKPLNYRTYARESLSEALTNLLKE